MIDAIAIVERNQLSQSASGRRYGELRLKMTNRVEVRPGQFAMLKPHADVEPLLRRAMAYYRCEDRADGLRVEFIYQILGRGTQSLSRLRPGDMVDLLGPLGNIYDTQPARGRRALLVAGGVGSAALYMLAENLRSEGVETRLFIGGASAGDLPGVDRFEELLGGENVICATIDGTRGTEGFVTEPLQDHLQSIETRSAIIYACGPDPMLHRVAQIAERSETTTQLSLESPMACGFGICVGCAVAIKSDCPEGFVYGKVCTDGPVFRSEDLYWAE